MVVGFELSATAPGDIYYTLDGSDPRKSALEVGGVLGGSISESANRYTGPIRLDHDVVVSARTFQGGKWSALNQGSFSTSNSIVRGDFTADGVVRADDIDVLFAAVRAADNQTTFDLTGDQLVNQLDVDELVQTILGTEFGDMNLDRTVDLTDFQVLATNFGRAGASWLEGDLDGNGKVAFSDFNLLANNFGFMGS